MKLNSVENRVRVLAVLCGIGSLALSWPAVCQEGAGQSAIAYKNPPGNINWQTDVWQLLRLSEAKKWRVQGRFASAPIEVVFHAVEPGRLACVGNLDTHVSAKTKKAWMQRKQLSYNDVQIALFDLSNITAEGVATTFYQARATQPDLSTLWYPSTLSLKRFSPDGRHLLLGFDLETTTSVPLILDTQAGDFNTLRLGEHGEGNPANAGASWSPDSQRLAYFEPGANLPDSPETVGEFDSTNDPRTVYIQDWRSNTRQLAAQAQGLVYPLAWLNGQTLLYGALPRNGDKWFELYDIARNGKLPRPNIYSYSVPTQQTHLLIPDGYRPTASPDGSLIAFFGSRDPKQPQPLRHEQSSPLWRWRYFSNGASLCVAKADGSGRIAFQPYSGLYPRVQWLPDNKRFVTIERTQAGPNFEAQVTLWNVQTQTFKKLATLHATDPKKPYYVDPNASVIFPFWPMGTSRNGKKVYVKAVSHPPIVEEDVELPSVAVLQSVDVETGQVSTIATVKNAVDIAWTATSAASP